MEDLGPAKYFIGVQITQDRKKGTISLCQDAYIDKVLKRFGIENCHSVDTPIAVGANKFIVPFDRKATQAKIDLYGSKIGSEIYLAVQTRPDIAYAVLVLLRFLLNSSL